jgi:hypothetical protein
LLDSLPSYNAFEKALDAGFPRVFGGSVPLARDFAALYPFPLVTSAVYRLTRHQRPYLATSPEAAAAIEDLISLLRTNADTVTSIRVVSDFVVANALTIGSVRVVPVAPGVQGKPLPVIIDELVPEAGYAADEARMAMFAEDRALLIVTSAERRSSDNQVLESFTVAGDRNDRAIDELIIAVRLTTNSTTSNLMAVRGSPGLLHRYPPIVTPHGVPPWRFVRRPATVSTNHGAALRRLGSIIRDSKGGTAVALSRFNRSYFDSSWWERLVDLTIALEAVLGEADAKEDITFRLRSRAASLLSTKTDSAAFIFDELGQFYGIRSKIVHGIPTTPKDVQKFIAKVPATAPGPMPGDKTELLVDRLRDLVRRAILLRLVLAMEPNPVWALDGGNVMDRLLTDESDRRRIRAAYAARLRRVGFPMALERATPALLK